MIILILLLLFGIIIRIIISVQNLLARKDQPLPTKDTLAPQLRDAVGAIRQQHLALRVEAQRPCVWVRVRERAR